MPAENPIKLFDEWYKEAEKSGTPEPSAMALATATKDGKPSIRIVLLKQYDEQGFTFYTHYTSQKGRELLENPQAALCFYWESLKKQVRIEGIVEKVSAEEADHYFHSRHPESQIGAVISRQSEVMEDRDKFLAQVANLKNQLQGALPPRPNHWSGFRIIPERIEFWQEGQFRLHDRVLFEKSGGKWRKSLLYP